MVLANRVRCAEAYAQGKTSAVKYFSRLAGRVRGSQPGQTMTEYVLIIAAIAVAGYIAYQGLEGGINSIIANVTATLSGA
jgi:Flp pilus assembly pilin Flp